MERLWLQCCGQKDDHPSKEILYKQVSNAGTLSGRRSWCRHCVAPECEASTSWGGRVHPWFHIDLSLVTLAANRSGGWVCGVSLLQVSQLRQDLKSKALVYRGAVAAQAQAKALAQQAKSSETRPGGAPAASATQSPATIAPAAPAAPAAQLDPITGRPVKMEAVGSGAPRSQMVVPPQEHPTIEQGLQRFYSAAMTSTMANHKGDERAIHEQQKVFQHLVQVISQICDKYALQDPSAYDKACVVPLSERLPRRHAVWCLVLNPPCTMVPPLVWCVASGHLACRALTPHLVDPIGTQQLHSSHQQSTNTSTCLLQCPVYASYI
jgi:hypothetical protein